MSLLKNMAIVATVASLNLTGLALTITGPSPSSDIASGNPDPIAWGNDTGTSTIEDLIRASYGVGDLLYKSEEDGRSTGVGTDLGPFAASYKTTFSNTATDPSDALIKYVSGSIIDAGSVFFLVKDGNADPAWYLYSVAWNGTENVFFDNFWVNPSQGAISHISIYGSGRNVPDGGATAALLGLGLLGLALARRKQV